MNASVRQGLDQKRFAAVARYIFGGMHRIKGFLRIDDALVFASLMRRQGERELRGGVAEIGVYYGRSYFLPRMLANGDEKGLAIDIFVIGRDPAGGEREELRAFRRHAHRLGIALAADEVHVGPSSDLTANDIQARVGPVRFFSVDGDHSYTGCLADAERAFGALAEHGVIAFDDFCNPFCPEVTAAMFEFLRAHGEAVAPICVTRKKLYVAKPAFAADYIEHLRAAPEIRPMICRDGIGQVGFFGADMVYVRCSAAQYAIELLGENFGIGGVTALVRSRS